MTATTSAFCHSRPSISRSRLGGLSTPAAGRRAVVRARFQAPLARQHAETEKKEDKKEGKAPKYPNLVNQLLSKAASRLDRGECYCIHCRGEGVVTCPKCQGSGLVAPEKHRDDALTKAFAAIKDAVSSSPYGKDGLVSNRCRACHGAGTQTCIHCDGEGRRN